jgi:hypothetical protein
VSINEGSDVAASGGETAGVSRRSVLGWGSLLGAAAALATVTPAGATEPGLAAGDVHKAATGSGTSTAPGLTPFPQQWDLNFETLFAYGESAYGAGDIGEISAIVAQIQDDIRAGGSTALPAYQPYVTRFVAAAQRLESRADVDLAAGRPVTARGEYLRAASYYNCALFFVLGTDEPHNEPVLYRAMQRCWSAAAGLLTPSFERVEVLARVRFPRTPGGSATVTREVKIPAYYAKAPGDGARPTVIINNGSDAQLVDLYAFGGAAALERGYNVLMFEGPGQGSLLFEQNLPFTPFWGDVISPLVDHLLTRPEVDPARIGLTGWSFGGLLVFRAAAVEPRITAVVGDPGFADNSAAWHQLSQSLQGFGGINDKSMQALLAALPEYGAHNSSRALSFTLRKRGEIYASQFHDDVLQGRMISDVAGLLAAIGAMNPSAEMLAQVRAHVLIDSYQDDSFFPASLGQDLKRALVNATSISEHNFSAATGAEYHCAPMAPQQRNEVVFDWMDGVFASVSGAGAASGPSLAKPLGIVAGAGALLSAAVTAGEFTRRRSRSAGEDARPDASQRSLSAAPGLPGQRSSEDERESSPL